MNLLLHNTLLLFQFFSDLFIDMSLGLLFQILIIHNNLLPFLIDQISGRWSIFAIFISRIFILLPLRFLIKHLGNPALIIKLRNLLINISLPSFLIKAVIEILRQYLLPMLFFHLLYKRKCRINFLIILLY